MGKAKKPFGIYTKSHHVGSALRGTLAGQASTGEDTDASQPEVGRPRAAPRNLFTREIMACGRTEKCDFMDHDQDVASAAVKPAMAPLLGPLLADDVQVTNENNWHYGKMLMSLGAATANFHLNHPHSYVLYFMNLARLDVSTSKGKRIGTTGISCYLATFFTDCDVSHLVSVPR